MRKNCSSDREKLLKLKAKGWGFSKNLRSLEQFVLTVKSQNNFCSWRFLISNKLEKLENNNTVGPVSSGQHKINRQQHNSTQTISSRCEIMLFYAFKMAVAVAFLCGNSKS